MIKNYYYFFLKKEGQLFYLRPLFRDTLDTVGLSVLHTGLMSRLSLLLKRGKCVKVTLFLFSNIKLHQQGFFFKVKQDVFIEIITLEKSYINHCHKMLAANDKG